MKAFANFLWAITFGWILALSFFFYALLLCITIIFIPVGLQYFKVARFIFTPFGYDFVDVSTTGFKTVINIIYAIFFGWGTALSILIGGLLLCVTIIFIPFGLQLFKLAKFALLPLGKDVRRII